MLTNDAMGAVAVALLAWNAALVLGAGMLDAVGLIRQLRAARGRTWRAVLRGGVVATATERVGRAGADGRLHVSDRWRVDVAERVLLELPCGLATIEGKARVWGRDRALAQAPPANGASGPTRVWTEREAVPMNAHLWVTARALGADLEGSAAMDGRVLLSVDDPRVLLARRIGLLLLGHALGVTLVALPTAGAVLSPPDSLEARLSALGALLAFLLLLPLGTALRDAARLPHVRLRHVRTQMPDRAQPRLARP